jgi:OmpA-OmpF porin, OOP family
LSKIETGATVRLNNIFFDFNKTELSDVSAAELNRVYDLLIQNPKMQIEITGHTDNVGSDSYNLQLSQDRANSVYNFLVNKGIGTSRLIAKGHGMSRPIDTNNTEEGRQQNRRVEFTILKK